MSNKTVQSVSVETKDAKLARLRKDYVLVQWPKFLETFPGMPGFVSNAIFEQKALEMLELGKAAHVSVTGERWAEDDLDHLNGRPAKDFLNHIRSNYNRVNLASNWRLVRDQLLMDLDE